MTQDIKPIEVLMNPLCARWIRIMRALSIWNLDLPLLQVLALLLSLRFLNLQRTVLYLNMYAEAQISLSSI